MSELFNIIGTIIILVGSCLMWAYGMNYELVRSWMPVIIGVPQGFFILWVYLSIKQGTFNEGVHFFFTNQRRTKCPKCDHEFKG